MKKSFCALLTAVGISCASIACADTTTLKSARKNAVSTGAYLSWKGDCSSGFLDIQVKEWPSRGGLTIRAEDGVIDTAVTGKSGSCKGKKIEGKAIIYYPNGKFVGTDRFTISVTYETRETFTDTYEVEVSK